MNAPVSRSPLELLADELGAVAGRIEREASLRLVAAIADLERRDAERALRAANLERQLQDRIGELRDGAAGQPGERGEKGEQGPLGPVGPAGEAGPAGDVGQAGEIGPQGIPGERGEKGDVGPQGEKGDTGERGDSGAPGEHGVDGAPGEQGPKGDEGARGEAGPQGPIGEKGDRGDPGADGSSGERGEPGERGEAGPEGKAGRDGIDGTPGKDGAQGERGPEGPAGVFPLVRSWSEGVHYAGAIVACSGSTWQAVRDTGRQPPHEDWICLAGAGRDGADGKSFNIRGTWDAKGVYAALDVVMLNGASFGARRDDPGICPGDGWQLLAMQGKTGKPGERGVGMKGERGESGPSVVAASINTEGMLVLVNGDGSEVRCDFYPVLSRLAR